MPALKFGLQTSPQHVSYPELLGLWQRAEGLGYDSAWLFDHFMPISGSREGPCFEGWTLLSFLAARTQHIHIGTLVTAVIYRNPGLLAKMGATLDQVSGGRLEMGLGAGWFEGEAQAFGIPFPSTGGRLGRLDEAIQVIRLLWTQPVSDFSGKYYSLRSARCEPRPLQKPCPIIWVGGQGERVTLRIVAQQADGWDTDMLPLPDYRRKMEALAGHCRGAGRDPASIHRMIHFSAALGADEAEASRKAEALAKSWNTDPANLEGRVLLGTPEQAAAALRRYADLGVEHFVLSVNTPYDMESIELYIQEVAPRLKA